MSEEENKQRIKKDQNSDGKNIGDKKSTGRKIEVGATKFTSLGTRSYQPKAHERRRGGKC